MAGRRETWRGCQDSRISCLYLIKFSKSLRGTLPPWFLMIRNREAFDVDVSTRTALFLPCGAYLPQWPSPDPHADPRRRGRARNICTRTRRDRRCWKRLNLQSECSAYSATSPLPSQGQRKSPGISDHDNPSAMQRRPLRISPRGHKCELLRPRTALGDEQCLRCSRLSETPRPCGRLRSGASTLVLHTAHIRWTLLGGHLGRQSIPG